MVTLTGRGDNPRYISILYDKTCPYFFSAKIQMMTPMNLSLFEVFTSEHQALHAGRGWSEMIFFSGGNKKNVGEHVGEKFPQMGEFAKNG